MDNVKYFYGKLWKELIYSLITGIYLYFLNNLNQELLLKFDRNDYLNILSYDDSKPIAYFTIAIFLSVIGIILIVLRIKEFRDKDIEINQIFFTIGAIILLVILILLIFIFINNPILRAIILMFFAGGCLFGLAR